MDKARTITSNMISRNTRCNCRGGTPWPPLSRINCARGAATGVPPLQLNEDALFPPAEIETQRRVRLMCVIVLRPWTYDRAFVVIVILIANIPIEPLVQLNRQPRLRRLITHRIRGDQRPGDSGRIGHSISLTVVLVDSISGEQRHPRSDTSHRFNEEEIIPDEVKTVAKRMLNAVKEIVEFRVAVDPVVVVAGADREPRGCSPI